MAKPDYTKKTKLARLEKLGLKRTTKDMLPVGTTFYISHPIGNYVEKEKITSDYSHLGHGWRTIGKEHDPRFSLADHNITLNGYNNIMVFLRKWEAELWLKYADTPVEDIVI